jgi:surfeit locus 1 family protein
VLVNRGWVASGYDRQQLPQIRPPLQPTLVKGIVTIPDIRGFHMGQVRLTDQWPQVIPYIDLENIQRGLDFEILPYVIWLSPEVEDYYERDWNPVWSPPEKSEAYAMQWFSFAAIALLLFIVMNLKKIKPEEVDG